MTSAEDAIKFKQIYKKNKFVQLLTSHDYADCFFVCGKERIPAHKLILACSSPVFESMFYGRMAESEIDLPDIDPEDLKKMLEYVYTDHTDIVSVTSAWALIYVCQKYFLTDLLDVCVDYVRKNLNISNLLISYEYAMLYNHQELIEFCKNDIVKYTKGILLNNDYHMKQGTLSFILDQTVLNASKSDLIILALKWAIEECTIRDIEVTNDNIWNMLLDNKLLEKLDFNRLNVRQYKLTSYALNCESYYHLSYLSEFAQVLSCFHCENLENNCTYKTTPNPLRYKHRDSYRIARNYIFRSSFQVNSVISPNCCVYLYGIAVTTLRRPEKAPYNTYVGSVEVTLTCNSYTYFKHSDVRQDLEYDNVHFINFPIPMRMDTRNLYRIFVKYAVENVRDRGEVLLHYLGQRLTDKVNGTVINFSDELEGSVIRAVCFYPV